MGGRSGPFACRRDLDERRSADCPALEDERVLRRTDILNPALLYEFTATARAALVRVVEESGIIDRLVAAMGGRFLEMKAEADARNGLAARAADDDSVHAPRRVALADAAILAVEDRIFEVVRTFIQANDAARQTRFPRDYKPQLCAALGRLRQKRPRRERADRGRRRLFAGLGPADPAAGPVLL